MGYKTLFCMFFLLGFGAVACIFGETTHSIIAFTGVIVIYALATEGDKE